MLHDRGQADAGQAEQAGREFGVEELLGAQAHLGQAGQILGGGMQDPFGAADGVIDRAQVRQGDGIDEKAPGAITAQLHEICPLAVTEARGPFGVDRHRSDAGGQGARCGL